LTDAELIIAARTDPSAFRELYDRWADRLLIYLLGRLPANTGIEPPRGDRYAEGCAIVVDTHPVYPAAGGVELEVEIWSKAG
jgi:hypothetical protein